MHELTQDDSVAAAQRSQLIHKVKKTRQNVWRWTAPQIILPHVNENDIGSVHTVSIDHFPCGAWWSQTSTSGEHALDLNAIEQQVHLPCALHEVVEAPNIRVPHQNNMSQIITTSCRLCTTPTRSELCHCRCYCTIRYLHMALAAASALASISPLPPPSQPQRTYHSTTATKQCYA